LLSSIPHFSFPRRTDAAVRWVYNTLGVACLALGVLGVFLPVLPTTPFILLAAAFFSRGSQRLHAWLVGHPRFGPTIREWQNHRVIRLRVKRIATIMITLTIGSTVIFGGLPAPVKVLLAFTGVAVVAWIWSFPSTVRSKTPTP